MNQPYIMTEECWMNSMLSVARHYGRINVFGAEYLIVNKDGKDLWECSQERLKNGSEWTIPPGEPADLCRKDLIPAYKALGRDRIIALIKEGKTDKEIKEIAKQKKNEDTAFSPQTQVVGYDRER